MRRETKVTKKITVTMSFPELVAMLRERGIVPPGRQVQLKLRNELLQDEWATELVDFDLSWEEHSDETDAPPDSPSVPVPGTHTARLNKTLTGGDKGLPPSKRHAYQCERCEFTVSYQNYKGQLYCPSGVHTEGNIPALVYTGPPNRPAKTS